MQKPPESTGNGRIIRNSGRVLGRLKSHPKAKALAPKFQIAHTALKQANLALIEADDAAQETGAAVDVCDALAREALTDCQLGVVALVRRDYKSPEYLAFFPDGFEAAKKRRGVALRQVLTVVADHILTLDKSSPLQAHVKPLHACVAAYAGPLADDEKAELARTKLETQLSVARAHWLLAYDVLYGEVRSMFAGRRTLAESFFVDWGKARNAKAADGKAVAADADTEETKK